METPPGGGESHSEILQVAAAIEAAAHVTIITHINPDADAYGSMLGLALGLEAMGKEVVCVNESPVELRYRFIPSIERVISVFSPTPQEAVAERGNNITIVCDCGDLKRVGDALAPLVGSCHPLVNVDHHVSNDNFGDVNLVWPGACSTSEIIYRLLIALEHRSGQVLVTPATAVCLLTGIVGDTGGFRYRSASAGSLEIASSLIARGADLSTICDSLFASQSLASVRLRGLAFVRLRLVLDNKVAWVVLADPEYAESGASPADTDGIAEELRAIEGVEVGVLIRRDGDIWRVSMRGKSTTVDLSKVAQSFGGGGHRAAAAFRFRRDLKELEPLLRERLREQFSSGTD